jgi:predicted nuclease of restriction endonuclease-like RecB superfamily
VLTKELLRVSRRGGGYQPLFVGSDEEARRLAARVIGVYQGHIGHTQEELEAALSDLESEASDFKLVRGFSALLDRDATFTMQAEVDPVQAREAAFTAGETVGVVTERDRTEALSQAARSLDTSAGDLAASLYADLDARQVMTEFAPRWTPETLLDQYDLSLAQTALFDAIEVRIQSGDPKALVSAVKRLRLMYTIRSPAATSPASRTVVVTGPDALFSRSRRYGVRFARLLRTVAQSDTWELVADIDDRGTDRTLELSASDVSVPGSDPVTTPTYDSGVEAEFATRFESLDLDWTLVREPDLLASGEHAVVPDFAFDYQHTPFRVFFEVMGFWTPEYVEKKLSRFADLEEVAFLVAVDESLGVGEAVEAVTDGAIPYSGHIRIKEVRAALREYESELVAQTAAALPGSLVPDTDLTTLEQLAQSYGVSTSAISEKSFPEHELVGRTLVRPTVLTTLANELAAGMDYEVAQAILADNGVKEASAVLAKLGFRVEWAGLGQGTLREL